MLVLTPHARGSRKPETLRVLQGTRAERQLRRKLGIPRSQRSCGRATQGIRGQMRAVLEKHAHTRWSWVQHSAYRPRAEVMARGPRTRGCMWRPGGLGHESSRIALHRADEGELGLPSLASGNVSLASWFRQRHLQLARWRCIVHGALVDGPQRGRELGD